MVASFLQQKAGKGGKSGTDSMAGDDREKGTCQPLSAFLTSAVRHGYMPSCFRDSVMSPLLKGKKIHSAVTAIGLLHLPLVLARSLKF